ncbi:MAG: archease [Chloroflexi bacterium]|nr:archease [Chloroflexota bacterium]
MKRYDLIAHTADTGLVAYGEDLTEAFANAAYGMFAIMTDLRRVRAARKRAVEVADEDKEGLLFEWLNHLIYLFEVEKWLFKKFEITGMRNNRLTAVCRGEKYDPARHRIRIGIKSATYYLMKVDGAKNEVQVIFDV